jgi:peptidylprolyl isomerase
MVEQFTGAFLELKLRAQSLGKTGTMRPHHFASIAIAATLFAGCSGGAPEDKAKTTDPSTPAKTTSNPAGENPTKTEEAAVKVEIIDTKVGTGPAAANGDLLTMLYRGTFEDGKQFDANIGKEDDTLAVVLGNGEVIKGWEDGLQGMKVGGKRTLKIPYQLAYGAEGRPPAIPAKANLNFDVELVHLVKKGEGAIYDKKVLKPGRGPLAKKGDMISIRYQGKLINNKVFDDQSQKAFTLKVGNGDVVPGLDAALEGTQVGGQYEIVLPPEIAFGAGGNPMSQVKPNTVVKFVVDVVSVKP